MPDINRPYPCCEHCEDEYGNPVDHDGHSSPCTDGCNDDDL